MTTHYTTFNTTPVNALLEPMFLSQAVNVSRYDEQRHNVFEKLIEKQLSFFWRPEEIDVSKDRIDWQGLPEHEKHIFISNLKYQTLLDSITARSVNVMLLPIVSLPEMETWIETKCGLELTTKNIKNECNYLLQRMDDASGDMVNLPQNQYFLTTTIDSKDMVSIDCAHSTAVNNSQRWIN